MGSNYGVFQFTFLLMCIMLITAPYVNAVIRSCRADVNDKLSSCNRYLNSGGTPTPRCCTDVRSLNAAATTTADRRLVCRCLKEAYAKHSNFFQVRFAKQLPAACRVSVPYAIDLKTDCNRVK